MIPITEQTVMDFYLELLKDDKIKFLIGKTKQKKEITKLIQKLQKADIIHDKIEIAKELWIVLFESSMVYLDPDKQGYDSLFDYFNEFVNFEELIFASDSFYRDHTLHSLWVYFLGEYLVFNPTFEGLFNQLNRTIINSSKVQQFFKNLNYPHIFGSFCNFLENVNVILEHSDSIRCVSALSHDLGYPLKKVAKINKSISKILPYFSISKFGVFNFQYDNVQQFYIENLLELLSCDINFIVEMGDLTFEENKLIQEPANLLGEITYSLNNNQVVDLAKVQQLKEYLSKISEKEIHIWRKIFQGSTRLSKSISRMMRFANDFEEYQHGIMSSYLLMKILNSFTNIQIEYSNPNELSTEDMDVALIYSKLRILQAMANHTSPGYKIRQLDDYSSILLFVDELEEFSRISRANQYRQFINEFCKTELDYIDDLFCVDFIFDDVNVDGLNPEISFKDKAKKFLNIFNIPELAPEFKIRFRCIGRLPQNKNIYELSIAREHFEIKINEKKIDTINYLGTKEAIEY